MAIRRELGRDLSELIDLPENIVRAAFKDLIEAARIVSVDPLQMLRRQANGSEWILDFVGDHSSHLRPGLEPLAAESDAGPCVGHVGPDGAGHFVKMVHNGIEYGLMQAYAEGFELMKAKEQFGFDMAQIAELWRHGSVVRSWLLDLTASALEEDAALRDIQPWVEDSGEGRWTVEESVELAVPLPVISIALQARFRSRQEDAFGFKMLAAMRNQFGGHAVRKRT